MISRERLKERIFFLGDRNTATRKCGLSECGKTLERGGPLRGGRVVTYQTGMGTPAQVVVCHDCAVDLRKAQMAHDTNPHAR